MTRTLNEQLAAHNLQKKSAERADWQKTLSLLDHADLDGHEKILLHNARSNHNPTEQQRQLLFELAHRHLGESLTMARADAAAPLVEASEPSDAERAAWTDATRAYVEALEAAIDRLTDDARDIEEAA